MRTKPNTPLQDAYHLVKRASMEMIFDQLKNTCQAGHPVHQLIPNYFNKILAALIGYNVKDRTLPYKQSFGH